MGLLIAVLFASVAAVAQGALFSQRTASAPWSVRHAFATAVTPAGDVVMMGGGANGNVYLNEVWSSSDGGATWSAMPTPPWAARNSFPAVITRNGDILIIGGFSLAAGFMRDVYKSSDGGASWTQVSASAGFHPRASMPAVVTHAGDVLVMGGNVQGWSQMGNDVWKSSDDGATWTQVLLNAAWPGRRTAQAVVTPAGDVVLMGGWTTQAAGVVNDVWKSSDDGATWTQLTAAAAWPARQAFGAVVAPWGDLLIAGGDDSNGHLSQFFTDVWTSGDGGATWQAIALDAGWPGRSHPGLVGFPATAEVVFFGGWTYNPEYNDVWALEERPLFVQRTANPGWSGRVRHASVVTPTGDVLILGGFAAGSRLQDVWSSSDGGATWAQKTATAGWQAREHHAAVVTSTGDVLVMGGYTGSGSGLNDVWKSSDGGASWASVVNNAAWSARSQLEAVALPGGDLLVIGGWDSSNNFNDVWKSSDGGGAWVQQTSGAVGTAVRNFAAAALPSGDVLLAGGFSNAGSPRSDVWRSSNAGVSWTQVAASAGWGGRFAHTLVVTLAGDALIIGGRSVSPTGPKLGDMWKSSDGGTSWTLVRADIGAGSRHLHASVVTADGDVLVMSGEMAGGSYRADVWAMAATPCPAGSSMDASGLAGFSGCVTCQPGFYAAAPNSPACAACPAGRTSTSSGATSCGACVDVAGVCTPTPTVNVSPSNGSTACERGMVPVVDVRVGPFYSDSHVSVGLTHVPPPEDGRSLRFSIQRDAQDVTLWRVVLRKTVDAGPAEVHLVVTETAQSGVTAPVPQQFRLVGNVSCRAAAPLAPGASTSVARARTTLRGVDAAVFTTAADADTRKADFELTLARALGVNASAVSFVAALGGADAATVHLDVEVPSSELADDRVVTVELDASAPGGAQAPFDAQRLWFAMEHAGRTISRALGVCCNATMVQVP